ncbi:MAG: rhomboid family intramembrane serine protease, partial [bacterium]
GVSHGKIWTLLTATFSHIDFWHFLINMLVFISFAPVLEARWGKKRFLYFYIGSLLFSSMCMISLPSIFDLRDVPCLGASGGVLAVSTAFAIYHPRSIVLIWGILPAPAWLIAAVLTFFDLKGLLAQFQGMETGVGHGAHLGGILFAGLVLWFLPRVFNLNLFDGGVRRPRSATPRSATPRSASAKSPSASSGERSPADYYPQKPTQESRDLAEENRLDQLLTKVSREGIESLSDEEKDDLQRISQKRRDTS